MYVSVTTDAGATWSAPLRLVTAGFSTGVAPVVRPDGTVVAPYLDEQADVIAAFSSTDGGATWSGPVNIGTVADTYTDASVRSTYDPSVAVDASGTVYAVWEPSDSTGVIAIAKTLDGTHWSTPATLPVATNETNKPRIVVSLGADPTTSGHLGVTYYLQDALCTDSQCGLNAYFTASNDGGTTWSAPVLVAGPIYVASLALSLSFAPSASYSGMLGDYDATVYSDGAFTSIFASATPKSGGVFDEAIFASTTSASASDLRAHARVRVAPELAPSRDPAMPHISGRRVLPPD